MERDLTGGKHQSFTRETLLSGPFSDDPRTWLDDWSGRVECLAMVATLISTSDFLSRADWDDPFHGEPVGPPLACSSCNLVLVGKLACARCGPIETIGELVDAADGLHSNDEGVFDDHLTE